MAWVGKFAMNVDSPSTSRSFDLFKRSPGITQGILVQSELIIVPTINIILPYKFLNKLHIQRTHLLPIPTCTCQFPVIFTRLPSCRPLRII